ncbi:uncharacterized protein LOC129779778 isoform X3 [Toxorhynchites rutilus septentrionalis]|uniref:uncharacterized protein LOC129779778 isoform X3 n=1 Tax=Toxorhynchites rutilus septentrionalis TaxID=329112 RepID=UPI0024796597|nr:uncharacterized protein LOC129779778 isoform X3 [Toxorhynchites rutilus septentrionalis]
MVRHNSTEAHSSVNASDTRVLSGFGGTFCLLQYRAIAARARNCEVLDQFSSRLKCVTDTTNKHHQSSQSQQQVHAEQQQQRSRQKQTHQLRPQPSPVSAATETSAGCGCGETGATVVASTTNTDQSLLFNGNQATTLTHQLAALPPLPPGKLPREGSGRLEAATNPHVIPATTTTTTTTNSTSGQPVPFSLYKTINTVIKSGRKIIVRVCEVTNVKTKLKMFNLYSNMNKRNGAEEKEAREMETTGHDRFCQERPSRSSYRRKKKKMRRAQSAAEFNEGRAEASSTAASKRMLFRGRSVSSDHDNSESEHSERSPLVSAKLDSLAKLLFSRSLLPDGTTSAVKENESPTRHNVRYQYTALDSGVGAPDRSPRERAARDRAFAACQDWLQNTGGRYESIAHLDDIGSRANKHWFLLNDCTIRTDRLMTLLPLPPDCVALEELPPSECPQGVLMELFGSLQHPYIYPVLDLGFFPTESNHYACLVMPFNQRGSLKDLIYKSQWNEPWGRKYTRKSTCLPLSQVQRLGRQILEALLFLRERGISSHGHLHSGNVILQNGVARLSGLENGLLGLNSRVNAVMCARSAPDIDNIDVICFGHLLFEMCAGYELTSPQPTPGHYQLDLERYPQVVDVLQMIFESPDGRYPTVEELVYCDIFRNIDLRELRGTCVPSFKHGLSSSTLSLLNAVRRRQGAILSGSYSEGSSPCTPPSTPRERKTGDVESSDLSSSDSEDLLDEIVIASARIDDPAHYDPLSSPIHYCDNNVQSDDNSNSNTIIRIDSIESQGSTSSSGGSIQLQQLNPSSAYKNSKSRRMEYSRRGMILGLSNPSQDSAIGSMTDGESSRASSFKLSSFASMNSPIDEGVEDLLAEGATGSIAATTAGLKYIDSAGSSPCHEHHASTSPRDTHPGSSISRDISPNHSGRYLEPPKLVINNHSSSTTNSTLCYTSSPLRKCATTEVFSQKYRVSSFEDMSYSSRVANRSIRNSSRKIFRSFEEERRIDSAFMPIVTSCSSMANRLNQQQQMQQTKQRQQPVAQLHHQLSLPPTLTSTSPKHLVTPAQYNQLAKKKNASFQNLQSIASPRDKLCHWRNKLIKSNECLFETSFNMSPSSTTLSEVDRLLSHGNSTQELPTTSAAAARAEADRFILTPEPIVMNPQRTRADRQQLFSLAKFKHSTILDSISLEDFSEEDRRDLLQTTSSISNSSTKDCSSDDRTEIEVHRLENSSTNDTSDHDSSSITDTLLQSPSHNPNQRRFSSGSCSNAYEVRRYLDDNATSDGGFGGVNEEKTPLLEGMELSPISPTESEQML